MLVLCAGLTTASAASASSTSGSQTASANTGIGLPALVENKAGQDVSVSGTVNVGNLPAVQNVQVVAPASQQVVLQASADLSIPQGLTFVKDGAGQRDAACERGRHPVVAFAETRPARESWKVYTGHMIQVDGLTKRYGEKVAVRDLTFTVQPGIVTGFLGPNGAGKSTTMRVIAGLDAPTAGSVLVNGRRYRDAVAPMAELGILLEARAVHTSRSAYNHLRALAQTNGVPRSRVDEVIELVGLGEVAGKRAGGFSLGMGQRLGIASALLGDPQTVVLDEPVNGLDPEGIQWVRHLLKAIAAQGRTVFVSSHLMSEMALTADHLIVVGRGELIADVDVAEFVAMASTNVVRVRTPQATELREHLLGPDVTVATREQGVLEIHGLSAEQIGDVAFDQRIRVHELVVQQASLEEAFMEMTRDSVEFHAHTVDAPAPAPADAQAGGRA